MADRTPFRDAEGGAVVTIDVSPNASKTEVTGVNEWRNAVQVRVAAPAKAGAANQELVRYLSERLGVQRSDVRILRGHTSTTKSVFIPVAAQKVREKLGVG